MNSFTQLTHLAQRRRDCGQLQVEETPVLQPDCYLMSETPLIGGTATWLLEHVLSQGVNADAPYVGGV